MTTQKSTNTHPRPLKVEPTCIVRWVFHCGSDALTCAIEAGSHRSSYDVCILPHWNLSETTVERFDTPANALRRHAEIASFLHESGWVIQYGAKDQAVIAA
jgi:hypothetical protein